MAAIVAPSPWRTPLLRPLAAALAVAACAVAAAAGAAFHVESASFAADGRLAAPQAYSGLGCGGKNISPALRWTGAPADTRSFAITMFDPDAPNGNGWWHWLVYDIPPSVTALAEGAGNTGGRLPPGSVQGRNDFGGNGYGGACPPAGDKPHRYIFTVYALRTDNISAPESSSAARIEPILQANAIAEASITAVYGR